MNPAVPPAGGSVTSPCYRDSSYSQLQSLVTVTAPSCSLKLRCAMHWLAFE